MFSEQLAKYESAFDADQLTIATIPCFAKNARIAAIAIHAELYTAAGHHIRELLSGELQSDSDIHDISCPGL